MTKMIRIAAVMGFAALSAFAGHAMATTGANDGGATHWFANAGQSR